MRLELENLEKEQRFAQTYRPNEVSLEDSDLRVVEPVEVRGRIRRNGDEVELTGNLTTRLETVCARCLKPVEIPFSADFDERFVTGVSWGTEEQHELASEDLNLSLFDGAAVDLDQLVREQLLLAKPAQVLCREGCQGLCPVCGADRNTVACECQAQQVDARWEKLRDLQF
ncbi:MAG TPA: DUF177 domain-containing protein [Pyrinomonadaceae bacterium]|nr:DUF177 domain-containing protein [Pyrinomonadaceae bacterium]